MRGTGVRGRDEVGEARRVVSTAATNDDAGERLLASRSMLDAIVETADAATAVRRRKDTRATHHDIWY